MAHGTPDWWGTAPQDTVYRLEDMAELAARLGSPVTYKRTGNVMFVDGFDSGLAGWSGGSGGTGEVPRLVAEPLAFGGYSAEFYCSAGTGPWSRLTRVIPGPALSILGFEYSFNPFQGVAYMYMRVTHYDGAYYHAYQMRYDHVNGDIHLRNDAAGWTLVGSPGAQLSFYQQFHCWKMTADLVNGRYDWIYFNEHRYDGTGVNPPDYASTDPPRLDIEIQMTGQDGVVAKAYVDSFIATQNEPR